MSIQLRANYKNSERFISVANFISKYYYELSHGVKLPLNNETLIEFDKVEMDVIKKFINSAEVHKYSNDLILREINARIFDYYSKNSDLNTENSKQILNSWRNNSIHWYLNDTDYLKDVINKKIETQIAFINIDNKSYQDKLKVFVENLNPYTAFSEKEIRLIDNSFFKKSSILNKINHGNEYFKSSKLKESLDNYDEAIKLLSEEKDIENLHLYFFSWVLHQLGNIYLVIGDFDKASSFFNNSFSIKTKIEEIPKPLIFSTQLKIFGLLSYFPHENKNWSINLKNILNKISEYRIKSETGNELLLNNLVCDANFYLLNGYTQLKDKVNSEKYYDVSIKNAVANNDFASIVKIYFTKYLSESKEIYFNKLKIVLKAATEIQKSNPYVTTIFKKSKTAIFKTNRATLERVKKLFIDSGVTLIE